MDLATKSNNIKDKALFKLLSIIISLILCVVFSLNFLSSLVGFNSFDENVLNSELTVYDSSSFKEYFRTTVQDIIVSANIDAYQSEYNTIKTACVEQAVKDFEKSKAYYLNNKSAVDAYFLYERENEYSDAADYYLENKDELEANNINVYYDELSFEHNYYLSQWENNYDHSDITVCISAPITTADDEVKIKLARSFDNDMNMDEPFYTGVLDRSNLNSLKNLKYYAVSCDGTVVSNIDVKNKDNFIKNIKDKLYFIINTDGIDFSSELNDAYNNWIYYDYYYIGNKADIYIQLDPSFSENDNFQTIYNDYYKLKIENNNNGFTDNIILAAASLLLLILFIIITITFAGHKNGEKAIAAIDKIPNDIHFIVTAGIEALICLGSVFLINDYLIDKIFISSYDLLYRLIFVSAVCGFYLFIIEWLTSLARQIKCRSNVFKNTLIFKFARLIYRAVKKAVKKIKLVFGYKPANFQKRLIVFLSGYAVFNLAVCILGIFAFGWDAWMLGAFAMLLLVVLNITCWAFIVRYIIQLDKIITAAHNKTVPQVNYNKLPQSLRILVNSLQYSRTELQNAVNKAVKDERMRTELITNVSHDLKTPLTSIINYVDLLRQCDINDENAKEYINVLDEKGAKLKRLIDDLIEASKATSGVITLNPVNLNLNELAAQAIVEHQQEFSDKSLELIFKGDKNNINAFADGTKTFRVIENLLSNALKYSAKDSRVYTDVYESGQFGIFEIKNISAEPLDVSPDELTERFVRGDKSRSNEGNGLGLSIADNLCKAMNGRLEITIDGDLFKARVILPKIKY